MAPSSSPKPSLSSKKLLISDPKPKPAHPNSASSSSATTAPPEKRTRDLPNLSDCHSCGRRINQTNPKDRLQPLDSAWRIVLLCRKCRKSVHSGQTCPYCFKGTGNSGNLFKCSVCVRKIHADCVRDYGNCTPWCYLGVELGFKVCLDCWIPELLKNSLRSFGRSENKGVLKDKSDAKVCLEKVVKDAKCELENKVNIAKKSKEQALRKVLVAKNAVDLANKALGLVGRKDKDGWNSEKSACDNANEIVDDAELAIKLHRAINSSPRISRNKCMLNSSALDAMKIKNWSGISYKRSGLGKTRQNLWMSAARIENEKIDSTGKNGSSGDIYGSLQEQITYKRDKKRKIWHINDDNNTLLESRYSQREELQLNLHSDDSQTKYSMKSDADAVESSHCVESNRYVSEDFVCVNADQRNLFANVDRFGQDPIIYKRTRLKQKVFQVNDLVGVSGRQGSCDDHEVAFKSGCCQSDDTRTGRIVKCEAEAILPNGSCDVEQDRYYLKYSKRMSGIKPNSSPLHCDAILNEQACTPALSGCGTVYSAKSDGESVLPNGSSSVVLDRYCFKYGKRVKDSKSGLTAEIKLHPVTHQNQNEQFAPGSALNCSAESRTVSDVSSDIFSTNLPR